MDSMQDSGGDLQFYPNDDFEETNNARMRRRWQNIRESEAWNKIEILAFTSSSWSPNRRTPPLVAQLFPKAVFVQQNLWLSFALSLSWGKMCSLLKFEAFHLSIRILATALRIEPGQGTNSSFSSSTRFSFASLIWRSKYDGRIKTVLDKEPFSLKVLAKSRINCSDVK